MLTMSDRSRRIGSRVAPVLILVVLWTGPIKAQDKPLPTGWDYAPAMRRVAAEFRGRPGVVLHVGDSITYSSPYGQWARSGEGKTAADKDVLRWMHTGADDDSDGWWLARFDHPDGGRSHTAAGGLRANELLAGGKQSLPSLEQMLSRYRPQIVVLMVGTNDASANRPLDAFRVDVTKAVDLILAQHIIPILSTIPPHSQRPELARSYNDSLRALGRSKSIPVIDFEREILSRRPSDWDGTLLQKGDVHPSASVAGVSATSAPTTENLRQCGYLLRGWLSVRTIAEVKRKVIDAAPFEKSPTASPSTQENLRLAVSRDTWVSNIGSEASGNNGGSTKLKLKSHQEMSLIDIDPAPLRGRVIQSATLHVQRSGAERLHRVTVGSVGAEWTEGNGSNYDTKAPGASHKFRKNPNLPWTSFGGDLCDVILGQGGTSWRMADGTDPDAQGWQSISIEPSILAARSAGVSYGFLLFDDTGSEWTHAGEKFSLRLFPNRFINSRDSNMSSAPYLTVALGPKDDVPPDAPGDLQFDPSELPAGETFVSWASPKDHGDAGLLGFVASVDGKDVPRYQIPLHKPGSADRMVMHLRDLGLKGDANPEFSVRAVDGAGNVSPAATARIRVSSRSPKPLPPAVAGRPIPQRGQLPKIGNLEIAIVDELDKAQPVSGVMIPAQTKDYLAENHLWSAREKRVTLHAARNEFIGFQIMLRGGPGEASMMLQLDDDSITAELSRLYFVPTSKGPMPDPVIPFNAPVQRLTTKQVASTSYVEIYIPHAARVGEHKGKLTMKSDGQALALDVILHVWDFTLPDYLSFVPEMNCYGLPENERDYYRLAHQHRTVLNRVPYHQNGSMSQGCAPGWDGSRLDWTAWDQRFAPYFDGSAFDDLPRKSVPIERFYLPLHENWPTPIEGNYNGNYWADRAFPDPYRRAFVEVSRQFAEHAGSKGWNDTRFQCFFNGKNNFKANGWSRGSSPWLLDEPSNFQDFWALRYFGLAFHEGVQQAPPSKAHMVFRCDISRPEWQRDSLDTLLNDNVVGGAFRRYRRMVLDRKRANNEVVLEYGGTNPIEASNVQPVGWSLDAWSLGIDGVLPWQTLGTDQSWSKSDELSLFYPPRTGYGTGPVPSIRLKAYRRGQQDVEYLTLLSVVTKEPRWALGVRVREVLKLAAERQTAGGDDAGRMSYSKLLPQDLWSLRTRIGQALSDARPAPERKVVDTQPPRPDLSRLAPGYVSARSKD
jgi:hypothetical protein